MEENQQDLTADEEPVYGGRTFVFMTTFLLLCLPFFIFYFDAIGELLFPGTTQHVREACAIGSLRTINASLAIYIERNTSQRYGSLKNIESAGYIDKILGSGQKEGYRFILMPKPDSPQYEYRVLAVPLIQTKDTRVFFSNQSGVIRFRRGPNWKETKPGDWQAIGCK
jgi:hypothetical protein